MHEDTVWEKIIGKLRHCARAMHGGAAFVRGLEAKKHYMQYVKKIPEHQPFNLGRRAKFDLEFWLEILPDMDYSTPFWFILKDQYEYDITLYTDASESDDIKTYGGVDSTGRWFVQNFFHTKMTKIINYGIKLINFFELIAIVVAIDLNKTHYAGKSIYLRCDNECALAWVLNKRASFDTKLEKYVNIVIKYLFRILIKYHIYIHGKYINTKVNTYADALSRLDPHPFAKPQPDLPHWTPNKNFDRPKNIINNIIDTIEDELNIKL